MFYIHMLHIQKFSEMGVTQNKGGDLKWVRGECEQLMVQPSNFIPFPKI